MFLKGLKDGT
jgi:hypothetical protein